MAPAPPPPLSSSSSSSPPLSKPNQTKKLSPSNPNPSSTSSPPCKHPPSATLDVLISVLVLISGAFLFISYFAYLLHSLSLLLPPIPIPLPHFTLLSSILYLLGFCLFFVGTVVAFEICCRYWSRRCRNPRCKGLKEARELDLQLQTEECLRSEEDARQAIDELPWKGGGEGNPDYDCLRSELRKIAPPNGRAVLLFRAKCGCPVAKLEGWGTKRRRHKKNLALNGGDNMQESGP